MNSFTARSSIFYCPECRRHWQRVIEAFPSAKGWNIIRYIVGCLDGQYKHADCPSCNLVQMSLFRETLPIPFDQIPIPNFTNQNQLSISNTTADSQDEETEDYGLL